MPNPEGFNEKPVPAKLTEKELQEMKRTEQYGRFLNLPFIDVTNEVWGQAIRNWRSGLLDANRPPDLTEPPLGLKEFIESKGYSFETGEKLPSQE